MVATPDHGTEIGFLEATLGPGHDKWDGIAGAVPAESPFLDGAARYTFPQTHGQLLRARSVVNLIRTVLALR